MLETMALNITDGEFEDKVLNSDVPVLVDFWAPWCGPCRMTGPVVERIAREYEGRLLVCRINIDNDRQTATLHGVMSVPTFFIFKDGLMVGQITGVTPTFEADLKKRIDPHLD